MKKILFGFVVILLAAACSNLDNNFDDFEYNAVYFPIQYPVRTLILGEDRTDNSLDNELKFHIGALIGGMYANKNNWTIDYVVDPSLAENLINTDSLTIKVLPTHYYTLSPATTITIPKDSFRGLIQVQLTDAFLDDPEAILGNYVIPLRMVSTNADSILTGLAVVPNPDKRKLSDWDAGALPKDFVLFGIKYINPYHGGYFHRGIDVRYDTDGVTPLDTNVFRARYVEQDQQWFVKTQGRNVCTTNGIGWRRGNNHSIALHFSDNGNVVVDSVATSPLKSFGSGKYVKNGDAWGGEARHAMFLKYNYYEGDHLRQVTDTLVYWQKGVVFEENSVIVVAP